MCAIRDSLALWERGTIYGSDACVCCKVGPCADIHSRRLKVFDPEDTLTLEEIVSRFKRLFNRDMTPQEKRGFFLPESFAEPAVKGGSKAAKGD